MKALSIGMFDSGVGGLTVLREVRSLLPREHIVYLGDTARVPYGNRSPQAVTRYALESALFLLKKGIKLLVVACNTSSALSLSLLADRLPIPVIGVIEPAVARAVGRTRKKRIGIIGTRATIRSMAYERSIHRLDGDIRVVSTACPLFVPIVEEGLEREEIAMVAVKKYLQFYRDEDIDVLVMGCTHYPLLEGCIREIVGNEIFIVDSGKETATTVRDALTQRGLLSTEDDNGACDYYVTDSPDTFREVGTRITGSGLDRVELVEDLDGRLLSLSP